MKVRSLLVLVTVAVLSLTGCAGEDEPADEPPPSQPPASAPPTEQETSRSVEPTGDGGKASKKDERGSRGPGDRGSRPDAPPPAAGDSGVIPDPGD